MILTAPYWLFAASAILIPIAIHLWNKRQGKTVKVGSLRWLEASASNRWSSIKLNNFWLLMLRCLILVLLAVALAQPVWQQLPQKLQSKRAVFVGEELLYTSALSPVKYILDSLVQRGYILHKFTPGFKQISQEEWQQINARTQDSLIKSNTNYWDLLPALAAKYELPQDSVWLFTSDQQRYFAGTRPATIPQNIRWFPVASDLSIWWLQSAIQTTPDSLLLIFGHSTHEGTAYSKQRVAATEQSIALADNKQLQLHRRQDTLQISSIDYSSSVKVQTEPLQIAILDDKAQQTEARYLKAAIQAISSYTDLPITIKPDTAQADWVFWLNGNKVPPGIIQRVKHGLHVWIQQVGKPQTIKTILTGAGGTAIKVHKVSNSQSQQDNQLWRAANGTPLLTSKAIGRGKIYTFRSGFSPEWSELGQSTQLPDLLLPLLFPQPDIAEYDYRGVDEKQLLPTTRTHTVSTATRRTSQEPLLKWFVLAATVLFVIERLFVNRRSKV